MSLAGVLSSKPSATYRLEFFASREANPSGYGEGETYLGSTTVVTDSAGDAWFDFTTSSPPYGHGGLFFSATATNAAGATSEFGPALAIRKEQ